MTSPLLVTEEQATRLREKVRELQVERRDVARFPRTDGAWDDFHANVAAAFTPEIVIHLLSDRSSLLTRVGELEAALNEATTPDIAALHGETECDFAETGWEGLTDSIHINGVARVWANKSLGDDWWAAHVATEYSDDFEEVEASEIRFFRTEAEARAAVTRVPATSEEGTANG